jgi:hypothetical protein
VATVNGATALTNTEKVGARQAAVTGSVSQTVAMTGGAATASGIRGEHLSRRETSQ